MIEVFGLSLSLLLVVAGTALCVLEAFAPGAHFVVIGVSLFVAGLVGLFVPGAATPFVLAGLVFATGFGALYVYRRFDFYAGSGRGQTSTSSDLRGVRGYVLERVTERSGKVKLEAGGFDPTYAARTISGSIDEGEEVVVVDPGGGNVVTVEAVDGVDDIDRALARERERRTESDAGTPSSPDARSSEDVESNADTESTLDDESDTESEADETA
ncbi:NfeD family protein [Halobacterium zhouii]|uniref:NfeD family protein n=1 Tax=Halobacterium zhouii TaxID=2902624 RepID=UPI001E598839|nr:NfeD family protein [Halobacterium zhouii]